MKTISRNDEASVVSGQQINLLGGPLFILFKIIGVIKTARSKKLKPIFWWETNDADFNEIKKSYFLDKEDKLQKIEWAINSAGKPLGYLKIDSVLLKEISFFFNNLRKTPHTPRLKEYLLGSYQLGKTLTEANLKFYRFLLGEHFPSNALNFFNPQSEEFIDFSKPFLLREALKTNHGEQVNAFVLKDDKRETFFKINHDYRLRRGEKISLSEHTLVPNLYTRSILQDAFLKAKYYLAGESEYHYLHSSQMKANYEFHKVTPAKIIRRFQGDIISKEDKIFFQKQTIANEKTIFSLPFHSFKRKLLLEKYGFDALSLKKKLKKLKQDYVEKLKENGLKVKKIERHLYQTNKHLIGEKRKVLSERSLDELKRLKTLSNKYFPNNEPANRVLSVAHYYNLYGKSLIEEIYQNYENNEKKIITS